MPKGKNMRSPQVGFWMNETSGVLRPAVEAYLNGEELTPEQIVILRAYLRQWMAGPWYPSPALDALRAGIDRLVDRRSIDDWLDVALEEGIDPL